MKEMIVNDYGAEIKNICRGCAEGVKHKCKQTQKEHLQCALNYSERKDFKVEKVPETWEELKELCKNIKGVKVSADCIRIGKDNHETFFLKDGTMGKENGEDVWWHTHIAVNRTPAQMWNIIKNLIGE